MVQVLYEGVGRAMDMGNEVELALKKVGWHHFQWIWSDLDGSGLKGNISLTQIPSSTHSEHSTSSNSSGRSDNDNHGSQGGPAGAGHQV